MDLEYPPPSPVTDTVRMFGGKMKLSCIAMVPQDHLRPRLILNLPGNPNEGTPSVNDTTEREVAPESMHFGHAFPNILQDIWEADPAKCSVHVLKLDVTDASHRGTMRPA